MMVRTLGTEGLVPPPVYPKLIFPTDARYLLPADNGPFIAAVAVSFE